MNNKHKLRYLNLARSNARHNKQSDLEIFYEDEQNEDIIIKAHKAGMLHQADTMLIVMQTFVSNLLRTPQGKR